jgi:hypothetical protein
MFQEALQFRFAIMFNYNKQIVMIIICQMPPPLTWQISQIIVDLFSSIVYVCVCNQSCGHWLLSDVVHCHFHEFETKGRKSSCSFI